MRKQTYQTPLTLESHNNALWESGDISDEEWFKKLALSYGFWDWLYKHQATVFTEKCSFDVNDVNELTGLCDFGQGFAIGCTAVVDNLQGVLQCVDLFLCLADFGVQIIPLPLEFFFLLSCLQEKSKIY